MKRTRFSRRTNCQTDGVTVTCAQLSRRSSNEPVFRLGRSFFMPCARAARRNWHREFPKHVVTGRLGNTPTIAIRHYLLTTDSDFDRATAAKASPEKAVQIPVQQAAENGRKEPQTPSPSCRNSKENGTLRVGATCRSGENRIRTCGTV